MDNHTNSYRLKVLQSFDAGCFDVFIFDKPLDLEVRDYLVSLTTYVQEDPNIKKEAGANSSKSLASLLDLYGYALIGAVVNNLHLIYDSTMIYVKLNSMIQEIEAKCKQGIMNKFLLLQYLDKFSETCIDSLLEFEGLILSRLFTSNSEISTLFEAKNISWATKWIVFKKKVSDGHLFTELLIFLHVTMRDFTVSEVMIAKCIYDYVYYLGNKTYTSQELSVQSKRGKYLVRSFWESNGLRRSIYYRNLPQLGTQLFVIINESNLRREILQIMLKPLIDAFAYISQVDQTSFRLNAFKSNQFAWIKDFCVTFRIEDDLKEVIRSNYVFTAKNPLMEQDCFRFFRLHVYVNITESDRLLRNKNLDVFEILRSPTEAYEVRIHSILSIEEILLLFLRVDDDSIKWRLWTILKTTDYATSDMLAAQKCLQRNLDLLESIPRVLHRKIKRKFNIDE